jgi:Cdc6-like AAA superfamily ATPase
MAAESNAIRAIEPTQTLLSKFRADIALLRRTQEYQEARKELIRLNWRVISLLAFAAVAIFAWLRNWQFEYLYGCLGLLLFGLFSVLVDPGSRRTLSEALHWTFASPLAAMQSLNCKLSGNSWEADLRVNGVRPLMQRILNALLGDDPDELLLPESYDGFRSPRHHQYVVSSISAEQLARKMNQMDGGTIAVCGPRGSGKTTLLEGCVTENDFSVFAAAPATFTPQDFLVSLFSKVCEEYIKSEGYRAPNLTRITTTQRVMQRVLPWVKRSASAAAYAVPALLLLTLGTFATIRSLEKKHGHAIYSFIRRFIENAVDLTVDVWRGENVAAGLLVILLATIIWRGRRWKTPVSVLRSAWDLSYGIGGVVLVIAPVISILHDSQLIRSWDAVFDNKTIGFLFLFWLLFLILDPNSVDGSWSIAFRDVAKKDAFRAGRLIVFVASVYMLYATPAFKTVLNDDDNPARALSILSGFIVWRLGGWRPRPGEPYLVSLCRDHLYRLRTVQTNTATLNLGTSQLVSTGSAHATSITSIPPNFPDLVASFREVLESIAWSRSIQGKRTVIAIDELDRLGSDVQALSFLSEVKSVFGVPRVHYLVSVAEDVGAAFVRRGLPYRDATDSSLDDVVHVHPGTLVQSTQILQKRAPGISPPYVALVHALSGGLARDLVRYGRRVLETEERTGSAELSDISRKLILEELLETLSGFRVLLARQEWSEEASPILESFRKLMTRLRSDSSNVRAIHHDLVDFAEQRRQFDFSSENLHLPTETARLLMEASCYAYFSLTLFDIFGTEGFTRRSENAAFFADGDLERLAEARQELAISSHTARSLLHSIRRSWQLPTPDTGSSRASRGNGRRIPGQQG